MRMLLTVTLIGVSIFSVFGRHHGSVLENELQTGLKGDFLIFGHHELDKNELCNVLRCKRNEVCLVKDGNAICLKKRKLGSIPQHKLPEWLRNERNQRVEMLESKAKNVEKTQKIEREKYIEGKQLHPNQYHKPYFTKQTKKTAQHSKHVHERKHHHEHTQEAVCSDKQLDAIGRRLKSWFGTIHRQEMMTVVHVAKHHVSCPKEVGWMFGKLDGDEDGLLTEDEMESMENDPYERCLRPFIDRCDTDADEEIDMDEWCDCFLFSGKEREEPNCHKLVHKTDPHLLGAYHPRCDTEGNFKPLQCHERSCWCVDKLGREFDGSRTNGVRPDCGQYEEEDDEDDLEFNKIEKVDVHIR